MPVTGAPAPAAPAPAPAAPAPAPAPVLPMPPIPTPEPLRKPVMEAAPEATMSFASAFENTTPAQAGQPAPFGAPVNASGFGATEPLTQPEPIPEPDPIEEELKSPIKAAEPVPGSIGSAFSLPSSMQDISSPNNVAFGNMPTTNQLSSLKDPNAPKKAMSKTTRLLIIVLGAILLISAIFVAVFAINGGKSKTETSSPEPIVTPVSEITTLSCQRELDMLDLMDLNSSADNGTNVVEIDFENDFPSSYKRTIRLEYSDNTLATSEKESVIDALSMQLMGDETPNTSYVISDGILSISYDATSDDVDSNNSLNYEFEYDEDKMSIDDFQNSYEDNDYVCTVE